ncbi:hypothetical protein PhaeoP97_03292 [Phaeobacter porticola]|uniref:Uncharacterized protein n=1 Tax=Phaeobacter porticola TaxID=1844006 RepID=A0A1L3I931_9RHOB|nr:hypothetical protein PhaeoP97_03292 [Phaeobacter porticola]
MTGRFLSQRLPMRVQQLLNGVIFPQLYGPRLPPRPILAWWRFPCSFSWGRSVKGRGIAKRLFHVLPLWLVDYVLIVQLSIGKLIAASILAGLLMVAFFVG